MTAEHGLQAAYVRGARGRRMRPVLMAGNLVEATLSARTETQLAAGDGRAGPQPRAAAGEPLPAAAIDWVTRADRDRASRGPALSAALRGARRPARRDRGGAVGERVGRGAGPLRAAAARRARLRARPRALRGQRARTTTWSRSARGRAGRSAPPRPSPMPASCCRCRASSARAGGATGRTSSTGSTLTGHFLMRDLLTDRSAAVARSARRGWSSACAGPAAD